MTDESGTSPIVVEDVTQEEESESTPTPVPVPVPAKSKPSSTRARAEARRRRILQSGKDRLSIVSGEKVTVAAVVSDKALDESSKQSVNADAADSKDDEDATNETAATGEDAGKSETVASATTTDAAAVTGASTSTASKSSSRLAQMRRRRYRKSAAAAAASTPSTDTDTTVNTENVTQDVEKKTKDDNSKVVVEKTPTEKEPQQQQESTTTSEGAAKKYLGVVKMRRKMLAEKKASNAQATSSPTTGKQKGVKSIKTKNENITISLKPILLQLLTVIMLFLVGFDVGVQNHVVVNQDVPTVHTNFALSDHGIGALKLLGVNTPSQRPNDIITQDEYDLNHNEEGEEFTNAVEEEEFSEATPMGASSSSTKEPVIDPIFGVDLDEITSGDGILYAAARMAVSAHRMIVYLCFTLPLTIVSGFFSLPKRLFANPPIMFLCAIMIRFLGKHILGGSIPDLAEIHINDGKKNDKSNLMNTDFVSMGTNFVKNYVKTNFPKASLAFTMFKDAKSDMFVIFCGFFLGLIVPSNLLGHGVSSSVSEEL